MSIGISLSSGIVDSPECIELLLQHAAKVNSQDLKVNTPAMVACFFNKPRILATLLRAGADPTTRNNEGRERERERVFEGLIELFAGKDAYDVAVEKEFNECKELVGKALERRGIKPGVKANVTNGSADRLADDLDKLKTKR